MGLSLGDRDDAAAPPKRGADLVQGKTKSPRQRSTPPPPPLGPTFVGDVGLQAGKNLRWVADQLGHSDPSLTLRTYAHAMEADETDLSFADFGGDRRRYTATDEKPGYVETRKYLKLNGDPGAIRTRDPQLRRLVLYPAELPGHNPGGT